MRIEEGKTYNIILKDNWSYTGKVLKVHKNGTVDFLDRKIGFFQFSMDFVGLVKAPKGGSYE